MQLRINTDEEHWPWAAHQARNTLLSEKHWGKSWQWPVTLKHPITYEQFIFKKTSKQMTITQISRRELPR